MAINESDQPTLNKRASQHHAPVKQPKLLKRLEVRLVKAVWRWQRGEARRHGARGALTGGGVCFWQWFGSRNGAEIVKARRAKRIRSRPDRPLLVVDVGAVDEANTLSVEVAQRCS